MKDIYIFIIIVILGILPEVSYSQVNCITDPPLAPVLTSVSIQPETGYTLFKWSVSPSPDVAAYILYSYKNGDGTPLDTIWNSSATGYTLTNTASKYFSVTYIVAAMRLPRCTSVFSNAINSIFASSTIDTCSKKITVSWNKYSSYPVQVKNYSVLLSVDNGDYKKAADLTSTDTSYTINDFAVNSQYCFVVKAEMADGSSSSSNKTCVSTKMQRQPDWINADQATIDDHGDIALSFTIDPASEIRTFSLERMNTISGKYEEIAQPVSSEGKVQYVDKSADTTIVNYYMLSAVNACKIHVLESNIASNIVLSSNTAGNNIILTWNPYKSWLGAISSFRLYVNTGKGYSEKEIISSSDTTYSFDYKQIMYDISGDEVCFYITASESSNPYGITGESKSSVICNSSTERITTPNVFTPNNDQNNDLFRPVLSFTPVDYHLIIMDLKGKVLFETKDYNGEWDGTNNGMLLPQGAYLWFLKLTTPSGKKISRTGSVTIIK